MQRRHQKIIEEGPVTVAPREVRGARARCAVRLAKKVKYSGVGTVEYLYNITTGVYSFLEVNPRLQVEHPVTETITGVNLPAVQLQIAMGIPLHKMPHIRRFYGQPDPMGVSPIDFDVAPQNPPIGHCMAARVTAEDPDSGFKPTSGAIHELHFRSLPGVTGNFSVGLSGGVHQFADSQFGHIFAHKPTRDEAGTLLVQALNELSVRGEIHCNVAYLRTLIEKEAFRADRHSTSWLDGLIAAQDKPEGLSDHLVVACGAVMRASSRHQELEARVVDALTRGVPPEAWMTNLSEHAFELIYRDVKYSLRVTMGSHTLFYIHVNDKPVCEAEVLVLHDRGLKVLLGGKARTLHAEPTKVGLKVHIDGHPCFFPEDNDPTRMTAPGTGKAAPIPRPRRRSRRRGFGVLRDRGDEDGDAAARHLHRRRDASAAAWLCAGDGGRVVRGGGGGSRRRQGEPTVRRGVHQIPRRASSPGRSGTTARWSSSTSTPRGSSSFSPDTTSTRTTTR